jgi:hypothetical protein
LQGRVKQIVSVLFPTIDSDYSFFGSWVFVNFAEVKDTSIITRHVEFVISSGRSLKIATDLIS